MRQNLPHESKTPASSSWLPVSQRRSHKWILAPNMRIATAHAKNILDVLKMDEDGPRGRRKDGL